MVVWLALIKGIGQAQGSAQAGGRTWRGVGGGGGVGGPGCRAPTGLQAGGRTWGASRGVGEPGCEAIEGLPGRPKGAPGAQERHCRLHLWQDVGDDGRLEEGSEGLAFL